MLLNNFIENYAELFSNIDARMTNIILEMIFIENRVNDAEVGFNLNFYDWGYFVKIYSVEDKEKCLRLFNHVPFSTKLQYYKVTPSKLHTFKKEYKIWCRCFGRLQELQTICNVTSLFIFNNAFSPKNNNNQLSSTKLYFAVDDYSFEMYGGILNHNTMKFCSFIKEESPLGCQAAGLYEYMKKNIDVLKNHSVTVFVNPPFDEKSIKFAIDEVKKILQLLPKVCVQFTVPRWSPEDYQKNGIYWWLVQNAQSVKKQKEVFMNYWSATKVLIDVTIFCIYKI